MGFGDKLKGLRDQAQQAVAENKDKIQGAVQTVGDAANTRTHGKYAAKIMKVGERVEQSVEKFAQVDGETQQSQTATSAAVAEDEPAPAAEHDAAPAAEHEGAPAAEHEGAPAAEHDVAAAAAESPEADTSPSGERSSGSFPEFE